jgi:hypothetical protein
VAAGQTICDPTRLAGRPRQATIKRHPAFCDDERAPTDDPLVESLVKPRALIGQYAFSHFDARISQLLDAFAGVARIYVSRADHHVFDSSFDYCVCARSSPPCRGARLQSNVQRGAPRHTRTEIAEAFNLSVIATRFPVVPSRYYSIVNDQNCSHSWIGASLAQRFFCLV